jgi:hypothetical protein
MEGTREISNVPGMGIAAGVTLPALLKGVPIVDESLR